jgi:hypothetical protein
MKVFISWSGKRSKETAEILSSWIRQVIQAAETWISLDIEKGSRWNEKINKELEQTKVGIICLNKDNLTSEWILFEAGALSKTSDAHVCTFLLDINPADIKPPLGQFQHTLFTKEDVNKLMHTINKKIKDQNENFLPEKDLDKIFNVFWPILEGELNNIKKVSSEASKQTRTDRELLEEILQIVRSNDTYIADKKTYEHLLKTLYQSNIADNYNSFRNYLEHTKIDPKQYKCLRDYYSEILNEKIPNEDLILKIEKPIKSKNKKT